MALPEIVLRYGETAQLVVFFAGLFALAVLERLRPRRSGSLRRRDRWPANLALTAINFVVLSLLPISLITSARWAETEQWGLLHQVALPIGVVAVVTLLVRAFLSFGTHYLMHTVPLFWRLHRVHHLDIELDVSTTVRFHPLEILVTLPLALPVVLLLGLEPWVLVGYEVLDAAITLWSHANLRLPLALNDLLRYVLVTPDLHRVHHSSWRPETNSNYGAVFPIWDLVFGTYRPRPRDGHEAMQLGLEEARGPVVDDLRWVLVSPFRSRLTADGPTQPSAGSTHESESPVPIGARRSDQGAMRESA